MDSAVNNPGSLCSIFWLRPVIGDYNTKVFSHFKLQAREIVQLGPAELDFLLQDLCWKLEHVLVPGTTKKTPFLKVGIKMSGGERPVLKV